ncbi:MULTISPECIES: nucleotidyltransferase domain-containing protein [Spirosoma]|uniref:Nucleotidyltransferase domain-containing protein n=1 Tax=Spirosoma sordidisoli TaxID=2502893 RepID=A0A4V1RWY7_9BACT|nr:MULTISPECIES: nucleotidyltransferase domain-containing protein [Spirosoma]RYC71908.1 nucleotidyltransferase domain-containing protein [Spirosoma sordidisoli]
MSAAITFGLRDSDLAYMRALFQQHTDIEQVWIYGSRAKGTNRPGSDIDLALTGPALRPETVRQVHFELEEDSPMPFFFDVVHWNTVGNENLKNEIQRTAQLLYQRPS